MDEDDDSIALAAGLPPPPPPHPADARAVRISDDHDMDGHRAISPFRSPGVPPRPLSNSRGRPSAALADDMRPRPPSRGRTPASRRKTARFVNDHFIHAFGVVWASAGLSEEQVAARLDHLYLSVPHRSAWEPLLDGDRDTLRAFRRGEIGGSVAAGRGRSGRA